MTTATVRDKTPAAPRPPIPFASPLPRRLIRAGLGCPMASSARRLLQTNSGQLPTAEPPSPLAVDSDVVVILAALLCALICVVGLAAVTRCARSRASPGAQAAAKGLGKKALRALPKLAYEDAVAAAAAARGGSSAAAAGEERILAECAICLSEFAPKEEIRVLPQCGHGFHVACVDTWLGAHSSCPSCRRVLVVDETPKRPPEPKRCRKCEAAMKETSSSSSSGGDRAAGS
ncbi:putative RING zinc finger domain superfamily protein [Panicum miliaceum]|uniref:RING zinc finger domain superfamily protein n=1 Tax=Panicum miliaceum TaxID=4540 RepID=A0A3L6SFD5_PANMI|nr:putative RING zinc finger domain superfamily protein [Panicum miliaceum]